MGEWAEGVGRHKRRLLHKALSICRSFYSSMSFALFCFVLHLFFPYAVLLQQTPSWERGTARSEETIQERDENVRLPRSACKVSGPLPESREQSPKAWPSAPRASWGHFQESKHLGAWDTSFPLPHWWSDPDVGDSTDPKNPRWPPWVPPRPMWALHLSRAGSLLTAITPMCEGAGCRSKGLIIS